MPRILILPDQSVLVADTIARLDSAMVVMKAYDQTPVFWSASRNDLDGNTPANLTPNSGLPIFQTDPPLVLLGVRAQIWARAANSTFLYVEVMELAIETYLTRKGQTDTPGSPAQFQGFYRKPTGPLPPFTGYDRGNGGRYR